MDQLSRRKAAVPAPGQPLTAQEEYGVKPLRDSGSNTTSARPGQYKLEYKYTNLLLLSLLPSLVIMAGFGGRPTLIAGCFGGIVAYIFDLIGTIEVCVLNYGCMCI
jgi:hypothetical protein